MAAPKRRAMGKGLAALLKDNAELNSAEDTNADQVIGTIAELDIADIQANPDQPRTIFDAEALDELAQSIKALGIIQPITVRKAGPSKFEIISGERRFRAAKIAGLESIPAYIRLADDQSMLEMALVENIQREELDPIEVALSYERLIDECQLTQEEMSIRVGKKRSTITNYLRLLKLQPLIQAGLRDKMIAVGHARALINISNEEDQINLYQEVIAKDLSVRQVEEATRKLKEGLSKTTQREKPPLAEKYMRIHEELKEHLEADVELNRNNRGRGKITITFKNDQELERLLDLLKN
ncbi:MAG: chromosome partitioning protein ParB [Bacteroidetes bacterium]|nr:MAG: chromosome partitioning protein ParB [Bacteroidota bacterium]